MTVGRPSVYTPEIAAEICERLAEGESLRSICRDDRMPGATTVWRWLADDSIPGFRKQYTRARERQADYLADEVIDIADDAGNDWMERNDPDNPGYQFNGEAVARSRLRMDARKWAAGKLNPKKYSDKLQLAGDQEAPVRTTVEVTIRHAGPGDCHPAAVGTADPDT